MRYKIIKTTFLVFVTVILIAVLVVERNRSFSEEKNTEKLVLEPEIRSEVFGEVYQGKMYTTLINLQKLEPALPSSTPYAVELTPEGKILNYKTAADTFIDYQAYSDGTYSLGKFGGEYREKSGGYLVLDTKKEPLSTITIKDNRDTDIHGLTKLRNGNFIVQSYKMHVLNGAKVESFVIEEQTPQGVVVFVWDSLNHIGLNEARFKELRVWWIEQEINDYFHGNSVAEANDGNLLISGRHINAIIKIDKKTGKVLWRLGGIKSDFTFLDDPLHGFSHQHSVSQLPNGNILLFDNGNLHKVPKTRVVEYEIDEEAKTARLVWTYTGDRFCFATGSVQRLPNGNTLIGWGIERDRMKKEVPRITEVNEKGEVVMHVYFPDNSGFYNVFKL